MRVSTLFSFTLRENPAEAEIKSHQLLLRAGYFRQLGSGIFTALPLGFRALRRIEQILRDEMDAIGGQQILMPVVHPAEVWMASGRWDQVGSEMLRFEDRRGSPMALAMTHEEVVAWHARTEIKSYRQLPMLVYQIQTKFRDEPRARGGLIRVREFAMKDSYSLDQDVAGLERQYAAHHAAYLKIFERCGLPVISVASDTGMMGGKVAHEFMYVSDIGEDRLVICDQCDYAANLEVATFAREVEAGPTGPVEVVDTPDSRTIEALAAFLDIPATATAKSVLYMAEGQDGAADSLVLVLVRGDTDVNDIAVARTVGAPVRPAQDGEIRGAGLVPGYAGPVEIDPEKVRVVVDRLLQGSGGFVTGANAEGQHLRNVEVGRDFEPAIVAEVCLAFAGAPCSGCGAPLKLVRGVEVGNIFQLGTRYTEAIEANFLDKDGKSRPIVMGSYGIGVGRLLACLAEHHGDDKGLCLPLAVAPFAVTLVALARKEETSEIAETLYRDLAAAGVDVLYDDRPKVSPGAKFAEADLRGMPLRVVISDRGVKGGTCELAWRTVGEAWTVPIDEALGAIQTALAEGPPQ